MKILNLSKLREDFKSVRKNDPKTAKRLSALISLTKIEIKYSKKTFIVGKKHEVDSLLVALKKDIRTLRRWKADYLKSRLKGITVKKYPGRKANWIRGSLARRIKKMRKRYRWGAEVINVQLKKEYNIEASKYRINRFLKTTGLIHKYPCTTLKKQKNKKGKKHNKIVTVIEPGAHTQIDVKFLPKGFLLFNDKCYVYNFIDHASNWSYKKAYTSYGVRETIDFINEVVQKCPFSIKRCQSDNGTEFTNRFMLKFLGLDVKIHSFDRFCADNNIKHVCIPVGEKELQGLVERSNRQDDQELYSYLGRSPGIGSFNLALKEYVKWRNEFRGFKKNNWLSPDEYLEKYNSSKELDMVDYKLLEAA